MAHYKVVENLGMSGVERALLYVEAGGKWVIHVWHRRGLSKCKLLELRENLEDLKGTKTGYNDYKLWSPAARQVH